MVIEEYTQTAKEIHNKKYYNVIEYWEKGHEDLIDPILNPLGEKLIRSDKTEVQIDTVESLRAELDIVKSDIELLKNEINLLKSG